MRTMSLFGSQDSNGSVSPKGMFDGNFQNTGMVYVSLDALINLTISDG